MHPVGGNTVAAAAGDAVLGLGTECFSFSKRSISVDDETAKAREWAQGEYRYETGSVRNGEERNTASCA